MYKTIVLAMTAVAAVAAPAPIAYGAPPKNKEFGLVMKVEGSYVSLNALNNGTTNTVVLEAQRLSVYPGTPAYFNGTGTFKALNFDINGEVWGIGLPQVGDNYGYAASAFAKKGYQEFEWSVQDGKVSHKLDAALNQLYACKDHVGKEQNYFLKFGTAQSNGQPPVGCNVTEVLVNDNMSN